MNGILFYRMKQRRTRKHVAELAGLCEPTVKKMEAAKEHNWPCWYYMALAGVLGVAARECARVTCRPAVANPEHVATLAALHGINFKEFQRRYGGGDAA